MVGASVDGTIEVRTLRFLLRAKSRFATLAGTSRLRIEAFIKVALFMKGA